MSGHARALMSSRDMERIAFAFRPHAVMSRESTVSIPIASMAGLSTHSPLMRLLVQWIGSHSFLREALRAPENPAYRESLMYFRTL